MTHLTSSFKNLCLRVPVDPISKMPKSAYERNEKSFAQQCSIDSSSTSSVTAAKVDSTKLKEFYKSIPDYNEINHLSPDEFYFTLKSLREKKKLMLGSAIDFLDDMGSSNGPTDKVSNSVIDKATNIKGLPSVLSKTRKTRRKLSIGDNDSSNVKNESLNCSNNSKSLKKSISGTCLKRSVRKTDTGREGVEVTNDDCDLKIAPIKSNLEKSRTERPKRNHSACSISWNDAKVESKNEIDQKFNAFFEGTKYESSANKIDFDDRDAFKTHSMPSSPLRMKRAEYPMQRRKSITIPKPFKMTER